MNLDEMVTLLIDRHPKEFSCLLDGFLFQFHFGSEFQNEFVPYAFWSSSQDVIHDDANYQLYVCSLGDQMNKTYMGPSCPESIHIPESHLSISSDMHMDDGVWVMHQETYGEDGTTCMYVLTV